MRIAPLLLGLLLASPQPALSASTRKWTWTGAIPPNGRVELNLVRGSARVVRTSGQPRIEILIHSADGDPAAVRLVADPLINGISIRDLYPLGTNNWAECRPPMNERGDFLSSDAQLEVTLFIPAGVRTSISIMSAQGIR